MQCIISDITTEQTRELIEAGVIVKAIDTKRNGLGLFDNLKYILSITKNLRTLRPDICFSFFLKPNLYSVPIAKVLGIKKIIMLVEGLGYVYTEHNFVVKFIMRPLINLGYVCSANLSSHILVLNQFDKRFMEKKVIFNFSKVTKIDGIGVNIKKFSQQNNEKKIYDFIFIGRYLKHKGICEFINALRILKQDGKIFRAAMIGSVDSNPSSISKATIHEWVKEGLVEDLGFKNNVETYLAKSKILVLPSYREALPRVCQEAAVAGVPCIVSDSPGCIDVVQDQIDGLVVPVRSTKELSLAMKKYLDDPNLIKVHSRSAKKKGFRRFDINKINTKFLKVIDEKRD